MMLRMLRTIFLVSVFAYIGFAWLDYREPGVVSDVMSVHLWLVPIIASGVLWLRVAPSTAHGPPSRLWYIAAVLVGLVFGGVVWHNGGMFGDFRLLLALSAAALPSLGYYALSKS